MWGFETDTIYSGLHLMTDVKLMNIELCSTVRGSVWKVPQVLTFFLISNPFQHILSLACCDAEETSKIMNLLRPSGNYMNHLL
jgi:hypothetical protein